MQKEYAYDKTYLGQQGVALLGLPLYSLILILRWDLPFVPSLLAVIAATGCLLYYLLRRDRTTFVLDDKGIVRKYGKREQRILFDEISQIRFLPGLPYQNWISVKADKDSFIIGRYLVNLSDLLLNLKMALDTTGLSGRYNQKKFIHSILIAKHRELTGTGHGEVQKATIEVFACMFLNVAALAIYLSKVQHVKADWCLAVAGIWPLILLAFFHILSFRRFAAQSKTDLMIFPEYDVVAERRLFTKVLIIGEMMFFATAAAVFFWLRIM